eukprot:Nk52_evm1s341 gene=Nk52_evmTU1s341
MEGSTIRIGVDLGGTKLLLCATVGDTNERENNDIDEEESRMEQEGYSFSDRIPTGSKFEASDFAHHFRVFLEGLKTKHNERQIEHIGVGICGMFNDEGKVVLCEIPSLVGWDPVLEIETLANVKKDVVEILNDAHAGLIGVKRLFRAPNILRSFGVIIAGTGIGSRFLIDGRIISGYIGGCLADSKKTYDEVSGGRQFMNALTSGLTASCVHNMLSDLDKCGWLSEEQLEVILRSNFAKDCLDQAGDQKLSASQQMVLCLAARTGYFLGVAIHSCFLMLEPQVVFLAGGLFKFPGIRKIVFWSFRKQMNRISLPGTTIGLDDVPQYLHSAEPYEAELVALGCCFGSR